MKKLRIFSFAIVIVMLLTISINALAMSDAEWVWYYLRDYSGKNGKNGCYLITRDNRTRFVASQIDEVSPKSARLHVELTIQETDDQAFIVLYAYIENANTYTPLGQYSFSSIEFTVDNTVFEWHDLINNTSKDLFYTTDPGVIMLVPEKIFFTRLKDAKKVSIKADTYSYNGTKTFEIDDYDQCANFKEFSRLVINYHIWDLCDIGLMNAVTQEYPMRTKTSSANFSNGQRIRVINCNSSISLRVAPDPDASRICMIPLGTYVTYISNAGNGFYYIEWDGIRGYASSLYLGR